MSRTVKIISVLYVLFLLGCSSGPDEYLFQGVTMGTSWSVKLVSEDAVNVDDIQDGIQSVLDEINSRMSNWNPESEVSLFNDQNAGCIAVSPETMDVVEVSQAISEITGGVFDATLGPLIELWGFGSEFQPDQIPSPELVRQSLMKTGYEKLYRSGSELCKRMDELFLNLSATAKGYGVDQVAEYLELQGFEQYLVEVGGELRGRGQNRTGEFWRVGIESPAESIVFGQIQEQVSLDGQALATSGDYRNYFMREGIRYSHIIDARTGYPVPQELASVTVRHDSAVWADGWATAILALGAEEGIRLAEQQDLAVYLILRADDGFEALSSSLW